MNQQPENNFYLTGDEARGLMASMLSSNAQLPTNFCLSLWIRLNDISQVQPPIVREESPSNG